MTLAKAKHHHYRTSLAWTAPAGATTSYTAYSRDHVVRSAGRPDLPMSSDPAFRGNAARYNPENLLVASLSSCHMLWYLHLCAVAGIVVTGYIDEAEGTMADRPDVGRFTEIVLRPRVTILAGDNRELAERLHHAAHAKCYIANSVSFPIRCEPTVEFAAA